MALRRLLALLAILGLALAALVLPVGAQTSATISITDVSPRCIDRGGEGSVSGSVNRNAVRLEIFSPSGKVVVTNETSVEGGYFFNFGFAPAETGDYEVRVTAGNYNNSFFTPEGTPASAYIQVPCRAPTLTFDPTCSTPSTTQVRVTGRSFHPLEAAAVDFDADGTDEAIRIPIDNRGSFSTVVTVKPSSSSRVAAARDSRQNSARATWPECPPGATTTMQATTSTTTRPVDTVPDTVPDESTTTVRPDDPTPDTPPVTLPPTLELPPTVELPPPTPGATLTLSPKLGPAGFVTGVTGTGFPPGPVVLTWLPGIGTTTTIAGLDGTIATRVLILPGDRLGPRALVATGGAVTAFDLFLVVPSTVQPSGQEVNQINRIRRFNNR